MKKLTTAAMIAILLGSCASFNAYEKGRTAEKTKDWDEAVAQYQKALDVDPDNMRFRIYLQRARLEAARSHFEKGKTLRAASLTATGNDQLRLAQLAATELELTVKLDPANQYAAVELAKAVDTIQQVNARLNPTPMTIDEMKRRVKQNITKAAPPQLNPASDQPISLNFPHETPVKEIYRALGNAFGINVLFDQAVKDDRIAIELKDVTAQQALERLMQAANHFYKVLDQHTIIVIPDNPQARRDYEDLVIRTFYLSNGDAEQVTNVVRTMIEARNVFPLKALNAITIRDTADKVRIAEKIIEANDKAKAEVVVDVELLQLDATKLRDLGVTLSSYSGSAILKVPTAPATGTGTTPTPLPIDLNYLRNIGLNSFNFTVPNSATVNFIKNATDSEQLANPQLRISEGEKATLHIGKRIPVPVTTFPTLNTAGGGALAGQTTSFQYQDVGIKVAMEPRVHHNREVTLKLTVEVSDQAGEVNSGGVAQPIISTRTIESTIRLKDGETNFLAGLIQKNDSTSRDTTPFIGELPIIGRLFNHEKRSHNRTDLMLTMTPHIVRIPDITDDDLAPMWVGTTNNLTFRGVSPRIESQVGVDPFGRSSSNSSAQFGRDRATGLPLADGEPGNVIRPADEGRNAPMPLQNPVGGTAPNDPFRSPTSPNQPPVNPPPPPTPQPQALLTPRISPQPAHLAFKPGEEKLWSVVGMDLDGLTTASLSMHYDPQTLDVSDVAVGTAVHVDPQKPPVVTIDRQHGQVRITSSDGKPLQFNSGGEVLLLRVRGGSPGESFLVMESPDLKNGNGALVSGAVSGGRARVE
jgi:general secretion pathway protein D